MIAKALLAAAASLLIAAQDARAPTTPGTDVTGAWSVDLRIADDGAPYAQPLNLAVAADGAISGDFYGSAISSGRYGRNRGRTCIAFVTSDGAGPYQHAACVEGARLVGQSWAEHRRFVLPWVAERPAP